MNPIYIINFVAGAAFGYWLKSTELSPHIDEIVSKTKSNIKTAIDERK